MRNARSIRRVVAVVLTVAALGVLGSMMARRGASAGIPYRFVPIQRNTITQTVSATGTLSAVTTVQVGTQVSGLILALNADFNDRVHKGELLAHLDPTVLELAVEQAQATVEQARADLQQKIFTRDQSKNLYESKTITQTDYETAVANAAISQANLSAAEASLKKAQQDLRYTDIYSPIDGIVVQRNVDVGQTVASSFSAPQLYLIAADLKQMQILVSVDEADIGQIHDGQRVRFTVEAYPNRTFTGDVKQVRLASTVTDNVVNYTVVVSVPNPDGTLLPGMTATVAFAIARASNVLTVPNAALRFRPTEAMLAAVHDSRPNRRGARPDSTASLWYLDASNQLAVAHVRTGLTDGQETEISGDGVTDGLRVIAAVTAGADPQRSTSSNPFQASQQRGRGGFRGGF